jgi:ppGpp synthetase/RelA/SpoT-type nucleotidyltranferase
MTGTDNRLNRKLLLEYDQKKKLYDDFLVMILRFLGEFIKENSLGVFSFEGVVMSQEELQAKIESGLLASCIEDVEDFVSVEILTFFEDDVHAVAHVLDTEFKLLEEENKQEAVQDPQRFGYQAPTYLIRMMDSRLEWIEYRCFTDCKVKVRVSSLLQHTWSRLQNRLDFDKSTTPYHQLRPTQRIVGLLELADRELNQLKKSQPHVEAKTKEPSSNYIAPASYDEPIADTPQDIEVMVSKIKQDGLAISLKNSLTTKAEGEDGLVLTTESVGKLILDDPNVRRVDSLISEGFSTRLKFDTIFLENLCEVASRFHIPDKNSLLNFINKYEKMISVHAEDLINKPIDSASFTISRGISILMVFHVLANDGEDREAIDKIATIIHSFNSDPL